jgi:hypothetical protein
MAKIPDGVVPISTLKIEKQRGYDESKGSPTNLWDGCGKSSQKFPD